MSLIRFHNVTKQYDETLIFREVFFRLDAGERVGLIGVNGAGKTTALRLILGQDEPTEGTVALEQGARIGYFSQFSTLDGTMTVVEALDALFHEVHAIREALLEIEVAIDDGPPPDEMSRLLHRQAALFGEMDRRDGWNTAIKIDTVLSRLGFNEAHRSRPIDQLSGGWRNRAALAQIVLQEPDVLLLDEPTNFLDIAGLDWLEEWLRGFGGGVIVVSHDRDFIEHVVTRIIEIENYHFVRYDGGFAYYVREKAARSKTLERQFEHEEALLIYEAEAIADRREAMRDPRKAVRRKLADIKKRVEPRPVDRILTSVYQQLRVPRQLVRVERLGKAYDEQVLFHDVSFEIHRGDRLAVLGPNGCGKTTLIEALLDPELADTGRTVWEKGAQYAYYNEIFAELDLDDTVSHAVNIYGLAYDAPRKQVHRFLEMMRLTQADLQKKIGLLSGGERARVALAKSLLSGAGVVLLDEPTNHLDLTTTQVMERALIHFPGAVVVVSHDRFFVDKVANRLLMFEDGAVREFNGNWTLYQASLE